MFKTKSFNLINEEDLKKSKKPNKYAWMRCLIIPACIGFILTLILVNVDFSGNTCQQPTTTEKVEPSSTLVTDHEVTTEPITQSTENTTKKFPTTRNVTIDKTEDSSGFTVDFTKPVERKEVSSPRQSVFRDICEEKTDICTVVCSPFSDDKGLNTQLANQYKKCNNSMDVTLLAATFLSSTLGKNFLSGDFKIKSLTFSNCIVDKIIDNAFNKASMENMEQLIFTSVGVTKMTTKTFVGLKALKYFEMSLQDSLAALNAPNFLTPMATTLTQFTFLQSSAMKSYDPAPWLSGAEFENLVNVTLNGNYFGDELKENTFVQLVKVENLRLKNCRISYFAENTFSKVIETLQYLDLSNNDLKRLSVGFLQSLSGTDVVVSLISNRFDCSCANNEFVEAIGNTTINFAQEPKCSAPNQHVGKEIKVAKNCCENENELCPVETTTTTTTESESTETETETTTSETTETTEDTTEDTTESTETTKSTNETTTSTTTTPETSEETTDTELVCKSTEIDDPYKVPIKNRYISFTIQQTTPKSILIILAAFNEKFQLLYFISNQKEHNKSIEISGTLTSIDNLTTSQDYIFCAIPPKADTFSPLNCRSHHIRMDIEIKRLAWLGGSDMPLYISLTIFGVILCFFIGALSTFLLLRWRPKLLKGSKRLLRFNDDSKKVFLTKEPTTMSAEELYEALRTYDSLYASQNANLSNTDYLQHFRHVDTSRTIYTHINFTESLPPYQRAPALPPIERSRQLSGQSTFSAHDTISLESISEVPDEHEYQSLEQYQEIYALNLQQKID